MMDTQESHRPPALSHILETCLYVRDMDTASNFYSNVLGLTSKLSSPRMTMYPLGNTTLILFTIGLTSSDNITDSGTVPGHGPNARTVAVLSEKFDDPQSRPNLHVHYCLAVHSAAEVDAWQQHLENNEVKLRGIMRWERGGKSVYFEDPDGNVGEIGSRGIWEHW